MYGWFTGLTCIGSCFGIANAAAMLRSRESAYQGIDTFIDVLFSDSNVTIPLVSTNFTSAAGWQAASNTLFPFEFAMCTTSKLLVLFRMLDFANQNLDAGASRRWAMAQRFAISATICCNFMMLAASAFSTHEFLKILPVVAKGAEAYKQDADVQTWYKNTAMPAYGFFQKGTQLRVYQEAPEAFLLLVIVVMFTVAGFLCARRLSSFQAALPGSRVDGSVGASLRWLRLQIVTTVSVVFLTFLLRTAYAIFVAVASVGQEYQTESCKEKLFSEACQCLTVCVGAAVSGAISLFLNRRNCFFRFGKIHVWMIFTPLLKALVSFVASPVTLTVALWGMTGERVLQMMRSFSPQKTQMLLER
jgi:hypothetical protein